MARYISLIQFTEQGIRNVKDTVKRGDAAIAEAEKMKRGDAAIAEAEKMGMKIIEEFWTMGAYDVVVMFDAPDDETVSAFLLKIGSMGNVRGQTLRAFRKEEMEGILAKIK
ncbi:MAG: GYD family protein [Verrucomicrobia bacterium]|nr:MAG: GYD family protein [Verrucomicrobiota bacterium]